MGEKINKKENEKNTVKNNLDNLSSTIMDSSCILEDLLSKLDENTAKQQAIKKLNEFVVYATIAFTDTDINKLL